MRLKYGEAKWFKFEFKELELNKIGKSMFGEAKMLVFEFKGFEMNKLGKSGCTQEKSLNLSLNSGK